VYSADEESQSTPRDLRADEYPFKFIARLFETSWAQSGLHRATGRSPGVNGSTAPTCLGRL